MVHYDTFHGEIDHELVALLNAGTEALISHEEKVFPKFVAPLDDADKLSVREAEGAEEGEPEPLVADVAESTFPRIIKQFEDVPHTVFSDPNYYKAVLSGEGDAAQRVHTILQKYLNCADIKEKGGFRQQLSTVYWDLLSRVARKSTGSIPGPKRFLLRFGILHSGFLKPDVQTLFSRIVVDNNYSVPVYYLDEWFKAVGTGVIHSSTTNEPQTVDNNAHLRLQQLLEKAKGKQDRSRVGLIAKNKERQNLEAVSMKHLQSILEHTSLPNVPEADACYTDTQKWSMGELQGIMKRLLNIDREMDSCLQEYRQAEEDAKSLMEKVKSEGGMVEMDVQAVDTEFGTIRQMAKMTVGRQGNQFPILTSEYFRSGPNDVATRENVITRLAWLESIDPEAFCRVYKNRLNRIVPIVLLLPTYGDAGVCWEPFDRYNRATSPGRIALPMYPKSLLVALLSGVADLRWQIAKEKSSFYWMEEGLTGNYYQWFSAQKLKGDVKEYFIQDYIIWITKESEGIQKLDKKIREIFWRHMPFARHIKEKLKTRSFVYQELYQRDVNRSMSDGY